MNEYLVIALIGDVEVSRIILEKTILSCARYVSHLFGEKNIVKIEFNQVAW